jgi:predicted TIM-barrel fold metal-dependent hydrolase
MASIIDVHVHPNTREYIRAGGKYLSHAAEYFRHTFKPQTIEEMAREYADNDMFGVLLGWDAETNTGLEPLSNDFIANAVSRFPETFIGFASVDPWKGKRAIYELERAIQELGLRGLKLHPSAQAFYPNDERFYPLWERCAQLGIPVLLHVGTTGFGGGVPGGDGICLKYARPIPYVDDVAAVFPNLTIICAHPGFPWQEEMLAVAMHKANVYMDLSGWLPKYLPAIVVQYARTLLQDKVMFGSDGPFITARRWLDDFAQLGFKPEVQRKILYENACRVLRLEDRLRKGDYSHGFSTLN